MPHFQSCYPVSFLLCSFYIHFNLNRSTRLDANIYQMNIFNLILCHPTPTKYLYIISCQDAYSIFKKSAMSSVPLLGCLKIPYSMSMMRDIAWAKVVPDFLAEQDDNYLFINTTNQLTITKPVFLKTLLLF